MTLLERKKGKGFLKVDEKREEAEGVGIARQPENGAEHRQQDVAAWLYAPFRWGWWVINVGPRIWWRLALVSKESAAASVVVPTLGFALTAAVARLLGDEQYGRFATVSTYIAWFAMIASYPAGALMPKFVAEGLHRGRSYQRQCATSLWFALALGVAAWVASSALLSVGLRYYGVSDLSGAAMLLSCVFVLGPVSTLNFFLLQSLGRMRLWSIMNVVFYVILLGCLGVAALAVRPLSVRAYVAASVIASAINATISLVFMAKALGPHNLLRPDAAAFLPLVRSGLGGWVAVLSNQLVAAGVSTLVVKHLGKTELGYYQLVCAVGSWVYTVIGAVTVPALSEWAVLASQHRFQRLRRDLRLRQLATGSLTILAAVPVLIFGPEIISIVYGESYKACAGMLRLSVLYWVFVGFGSWYWISFSAMGHPGRVMLPNVAYSIVMMGTTWMLLTVVPIGMLAPVAGLAAGHFSWMAVYEVIFRRTLARESNRTHASAQQHNPPASLRRVPSRL